VQRILPRGQNRCYDCTFLAELGVRECFPSMTLQAFLLVLAVFLQSSVASSQASSDTTKGSSSDSASLALVLPPPSGPSQNLTLPTARTPKVKCARRPLFHSDTCPLLHDCTQAIGKLPILYSPGTFHAGPPGDIYQIPLRRIVGSCVVSIEMAAGV